MCFTETRMVSNNLKFIIRECKQAEACLNQRIQNPRPSWVAAQCHGYQGSVCRCCCNFHMCNENEKSQCTLGGKPKNIENDYLSPTKCSSVEELPNGKSVCYLNPDEHRVICSFSCNTGYDMVGESVSLCTSSSTKKPNPHKLPTCLLSKGKNNDYTVIKNHCNNLKIPIFGSKVCTSNTNVEDSTCEFSCKEGYELVGNSVLKCTTKGYETNWSHKLPLCKPLECEEVPLRRVFKKCTNFNKLGSVCNYSCQRDAYQLTSTDSTVCQANGTWSKSVPCCKLPCPPNEIMDLIILLDSSSSVKKANWKLMVNFLKMVIRKLNLGLNATQVTVIRYNEDVDRVNQLFLTTSFNETHLEESLKSIPYNGYGTKTGKALKYVNDELLKRGRPDVPDVILLLTDGRATDDVKSPADELRTKSVEIFAIGVANARKKQLLEIVGSKAKLWPAITKFEQLDENVATDIGNHICLNSCA